MTHTRQVPVSGGFAETKVVRLPTAAEIAEANRPQTAQDAHRPALLPPLEPWRGQEQESGFYPFEQ